ncbi:Death-inducer obliterator 1 [Trichinella nativa]|uniref:Death-inducer obliterator 1 n=1 Tax=Trichinella nativa TaxID=6335 RepID=A0A0V1LT58_9BILA|nr:Death-inducer obliterator 1 [Trichinella nativa]
MKRDCQLQYAAFVITVRMHRYNLSDTVVNFVRAIFLIFLLIVMADKTDVVPNSASAMPVRSRDQCDGYCDDEHENNTTTNNYREFMGADSSPYVDVGLQSLLLHPPLDADKIPYSSPVSIVSHPVISMEMDNRSREDLNLLNSSYDSIIDSFVEKDNFNFPAENGHRNESPVLDSLIEDYENFDVNVFTKMLESVDSDSPSNGTPTRLENMCDLRLKVDDESDNSFSVDDVANREESEDQEVVANFDSFSADDAANQGDQKNQELIANLDTFAVDDVANEEKHEDQVVVVANLETEKSPSSSSPASTVLENAESQSEVNANEKMCGFSFDNPPHLINEWKNRSFLASCCRLEWTKFFQKNGEFVKNLLSRSKGSTTNTTTSKVENKMQKLQTNYAENAQNYSEDECNKMNSESCCAKNNNGISVGGVSLVAGQRAVCRLCEKEVAMSRTIGCLECKQRIHRPGGNYPCTDQVIVRVDKKYVCPLCGVVNKLPKSARMPCSKLQNDVEKKSAVVKSICIWCRKMFDHVGVEKLLYCSDVCIDSVVNAVGIALEWKQKERVILANATGEKPLAPKLKNLSEVLRKERSYWPVLDGSDVGMIESLLVRLPDTIEALVSSLNEASKRVLYRNKDMTLPAQTLPNDELQELAESADQMTNKAEYKEHAGRKHKCAYDDDDDDEDMGICAEKRLKMQNNDQLNEKNVTFEEMEMQGKQKSHSASAKQESLAVERLCDVGTDGKESQNANSMELTRKTRVAVRKFLRDMLAKQADSLFISMDYETIKQISLTIDNEHSRLWQMFFSGDLSVSQLIQYSLEEFEKRGCLKQRTAAAVPLNGDGRNSAAQVTDAVEEHGQNINFTPQIVTSEQQQEAVLEFAGSQRNVSEKVCPLNSAKTRISVSSSKMIIEELWKGTLILNDLALVASMLPVSGPTHLVRNEIAPQLKLIGQTAKENILNYLREIRDFKGTDLILVRFAEPVLLNHRKCYHDLCCTMSRKNIFYVVDKNSMPWFKDFYVMDLAAKEPVNDVLLPFDGPGVPDTGRDMLLGAIVRIKENYPSLSSSSALSLPVQPSAGFGYDQNHEDDITEKLHPTIGNVQAENVPLTPLMTNGADMARLPAPVVNNSGNVGGGGMLNSLLPLIAAQDPATASQVQQMLSCSPDPAAMENTLLSLASYLSQAQQMGSGAAASVIMQPVRAHLSTHPPPPPPPPPPPATPQTVLSAVQHPYTVPPAGMISSVPPPPPPVCAAQLPRVTIPPPCLPVPTALPFTMLPPPMGPVPPQQSLPPPQSSIPSMAIRPPPPASHLLPGRFFHGRHGYVQGMSAVRLSNNVNLNSGSGNNSRKEKNESV